MCVQVTGGVCDECEQVNSAHLCSHGGHSSEQALTWPLSSQACDLGALGEERKQTRKQNHIPALATGRTWAADQNLLLTLGQATQSPLPPPALHSCPPVWPVGPLGLFCSYPYPGPFSSLPSDFWCSCGWVSILVWLVLALR